MSRIEIELEHVIGFQGRTSQCVSYYPGDRRRFLYTLGSVIVNASLDDPHDQRFMHGHDAPANCLVPSSSGKFLASGQLECTTRAGRASNVIVWELSSGRPVHVFSGHTLGIVAIGWSPDDRFVSTSALDGRLCIWDMATGACVGGHRPSADLTSCSFTQWLPVNLGTDRRPIYQFVAGYPSQVRVYTWAYDVKSSQFVLSSQTCAVPGAGTGPGLVRTYSSAVVDPSGAFALCGTAVGEMVVYGTAHALYRVAMPVCANGVLSMAVLPTNNRTTTPVPPPTPSGSGGVNPIVVFVGGGDGSLKRLRGYDQQWELTGQIKIAGRVTAMCVLQPEQSVGDELLVATDEGHLYRVSCADLQYHTRVMQGHTGEVRSLSYDGEHSDVLASCSSDGTVRVWDLNTYQPLCEVRLPASSASTQAAVIPTAVTMFVSPEERRTIDRGGAPTFPTAPVSTFSSEMAVCSAWTDGSLRCHAVRSGRLMWQINQAHRGVIGTLLGVPLQGSLDAQTAMVVSSGLEDGHVRIWNCRTRDNIALWAEHGRGCSSITLDVRNNQKFMMRPGQTTSHMFMYSTGLHDKMLVTLDMRKPQRREKSHSFPESAILCVAQRRFQDYEILCGTADGRVVVFDEDVPDKPVRIVQAIPMGQNSSTTQAVQTQGRGGPTNQLQLGSKSSGPAIALRVIAVSPSGKFTLTAGDDGILRVWDSALTTCMAQGACHTLPIVSACWSPDEKQIVTAGLDGAVCIWNAYETQ